MLKVMVESTPHRSVCVREREGVCEREQVCGRTGARASNTTLPFTRGHGAVSHRGSSFRIRPPKKQVAGCRPGAGAQSHQPCPKDVLIDWQLQQRPPIPAHGGTWMGREELEQLQRWYMPWDTSNPSAVCERVASRAGGRAVQRGSQSILPLAMPLPSLLPLQHAH